MTAVPTIQPAAFPSSLVAPGPSKVAAASGRDFTRLLAGTDAPDGKPAGTGPGASAAPAIPPTEGGQIDAAPGNPLPPIVAIPDPMASPDEAIVGLATPTFAPKDATPIAAGGTTKPTLMRARLLASATPAPAAQGAKVPDATIGDDTPSEDDDAEQEPDPHGEVATDLLLPPLPTAAAPATAIALPLPVAAAARADAAPAIVGESAPFRSAVTAPLQLAAAPPVAAAQPASNGLPIVPPTAGPFAAADPTLASPMPTGRRGVVDEIGVRTPQPRATAAAATSATTAPNDLPPPVTLSQAAPASPALGTAMPAGHAFAAAIEAADRQDRLAARGGLDANAATAMAAPSVAPVAATTKADDASLDMRQQGWPAAMVDHIERLRDAADATSTRIRVVPDALGSIDVSLRRHDDGGVHVSLVADQPATQAMIADARPELARLADQRGTRLDVSVGGGSAGFGGDPRPAHHPQAPTQAGQRAAAPAPLPDDPVDPAAGRVA